MTCVTSTASRHASSDATSVKYLQLDDSPTGQSASSPRNKNDQGVLSALSVDWALSVWCVLYADAEAFPRSHVWSSSARVWHSEWQSATPSTTRAFLCQLLSVGRHWHVSLLPHTALSLQRHLAPAGSSWGKTTLFYFYLVAYQIFQQISSLALQCQCFIRLSGGASVMKTSREITFCLPFKSR